MPINREWFCLAFAVLVLLPAGSTAVAVANEPHHHLLLQNAHLRAFRVDLPAHEQTLLHHHAENFVSVTLGEAQIENDVSGKPPTTLTTALGDVRMTSAPLLHLVKNVGDTPFRNITVEILSRGSQPPTDSSSPQLPARATEGVTRTEKGETAAVRVFETVINTGVTVSEHVHRRPHLLIALSDLALESDFAGRPPETLRLTAGEVRWFDAGLRHSVKNVAAQPAHYVSLEFK